MKKFIQPVLDGGLPIRNSDLTGIIQEQLFGINQGFYLGLQSINGATAGIGGGIIINSLEFGPFANDNNFNVVKKIKDA